LASDQESYCFGNSGVDNIQPGSYTEIPIP